MPIPLLAIAAAQAAGQIGSSIFSAQAARRGAKASRRQADELNNLMREIANRLRGAPGIQPVATVAGLESQLGSIYGGLLKTRGEDIFRNTGQIGENAAQRIQEAVTTPGRNYEDITRQTTEASLENLAEFFGKRNGVRPISPTS